MHEFLRPAGKALDLSRPDGRGDAVGAEIRYWFTQVQHWFYLRVGIEGEFYLGHTLIRDLDLFNDKLPKSRSFSGQAVCAALKIFKTETAVHVTGLRANGLVGCIYEYYADARYDRTVHVCDRPADARTLDRIALADRLDRAARGSRCGP